MNLDNFVHYKTGIATIDNDHWCLFEILNTIIEMYKHKQFVDANRLFADTFVPRTIDHFRYEERLMERAKFPYASSHASIHYKLATELTNILNDLHRCTTRTFESLSIIVQKHIDEEDMQYIAHINALLEKKIDL
jgi:hemerythrin-like metal-binding protein